MTARVLDAAATSAALSPLDAVEAIRTALAGPVDPAHDVARRSVDLGGGAEMLIMPSAAGGGVGVKILTVGGRDHAAGVPRIQGQYLLFDRATLSPSMLIDGAALTTVRTPAVSFAPLLPMLTASGDLDVVIVGTGPQALAHQATLRGLVGERRVAATYVGRTAPDDVTDWAPAGSAAAREALAAARLVVCATTARAPVVDLSDVRGDAVVVAVGSHSPDAREVGSALMSAAQVVVEDRATALRECGDVVLAVAEGALDPATLVPMRDVVRGDATLRSDLPVVVKTSGMAWEDLVIADAIAAAVGRHEV